MAIIKGRKLAGIPEVTPYVEDIDKAASGIMARETRANEVRNAINESKAAMIKQTRDNTEDFELAQGLEKSFSDDVGVLIDSADRDYSTISRDQLQSLATTHAGKTNFRVLSNAKKNSDEYEAALQKNRGQFGPPVVFGIDPTKAKLFKDDGSVNHMTGKWEVEKRLDHSQAAKKLYDGIGKHLTEEVTNKFATDAGYASIPNADGSSEPAWVRYLRMKKTGDTTNIPNVDAIINSALSGFITDPEGKQYYRIEYEKYKKENPSADHKEADKAAKLKVQNLILAYGESEYITAHTEATTTQPLDKGARRPAGSGPKSNSKSGAGAKLKPIIKA